MKIKRGIGLGEFQSSHDIQEYLKCHPVTARILWNRQFKKQEDLTIFLNPQLNELPNPFCILDLEKSAQRVMQAIQNQESIAVYGDYDVDGTCGMSLLTCFFKEIGVEVLTYQPDRFKEGYGVHPETVGKLISNGARCIITVDCGITAIEAAKVAKSQNVDLIIIDHHKFAQETPEAFAIINPHHPQDTSGLKNLCGTGLAFFFVMGLRSLLRENNYFKNIPEPNLLRYLDLVAVATVADMVDIRGVNRILLSYGLKVLSQNPRIGLKAILKAANILQPTTYHCGFTIGPRLNAAGRVLNAKAAFNLLISQNEEEAVELAKQLEEINTERRKLQDEVVQEALLQAQEQMIQTLQPNALVLFNSNWHEGVLGIVASRIVEEFKRPTFVLSKTESGILKGSVRSLPKIDILAAISHPRVASFLKNFGGHAHAGGVSLEPENLEGFIQAINKQLALTTSTDQYVKKITCDTEVQAHELNGVLVEELERLAPFGQGFPEPILKLVDAHCTKITTLKEKHLKMKLNDGLEAIWFNAKKTPDEVSSTTTFLVKPEWNEWQGRKRLQLRVVHY